jgi:hypothetical protein
MSDLAPSSSLPNGSSGKAIVDPPSTSASAPASAEAARASTPGLQTAASAWVLRVRTQVREGSVRAIFKRQNPSRRLVISYTLAELRAQMDVGAGQPLRLVAPKNEASAGDASQWRCDCPVGVGTETLCLHAALAARGLTDPVEAGEADADEAPDPSFVAQMEVSSGLANAAAHSQAMLERADDGIRVLEATVTKGANGLVCNCPLGSAPSCLHRVLVDAWARGARPARVTAGAVAAIAQAITARTGSDSADAEMDRPKQGERLPPEDVERFKPILERCDVLVSELLTFGLQRMSKATLERVDSLVMLARSAGVRDAAPREAGLGRLVRALEALRQVLDEFLQRLVTTTEREVLRALGVVRNLCRAVRANTGALPLIDFAGATQQEYEPVAVLDVQGLGFEAWVTPTGFAGVTTYVADCRTGRIYTRTQALPAELAEQFASRNWSSGWSDQLAAQPAFGGRSENGLDLAKNRFLLSGALLAQDSGRLSGSSKTQLAKRPPLPLDDARLRPTLLLGAGDAVRIARRLGFDALGRPPSSPPVALIPLKAISDSHFDDATQELSIGFLTTSDVELSCVLTYREDRELWFNNLERLTRAASPPRAIFGRLQLDAGGFRVEPITAYFEKGSPRHLTHGVLDVPARSEKQVVSIEVKS